MDLVAKVAGGRDLELLSSRNPTVGDDKAYGGQKVSGASGRGTHELSDAPATRGTVENHAVLETELFTGGLSIRMEGPQPPSSIGAFELVPAEVLKLPPKKLEGV